VPTRIAIRGQAEWPSLRLRIARQAIRQANDTCANKSSMPHRLRGTFATLMSEAGVPIQTVQRVMRHKNFTTTMGYLEKIFDVAVHVQERISVTAGL
jgi:integrase/recombinase XerC